MNHVVLMGRLARDPDVRYVQGSEPLCVTKYTLAVDRRRGKQGDDLGTDFISCVAFGKTGEFAEKYLRKGTKICVSGRIQTGSYVKKDGTKVYTTEVVVEEHDFCEGRKSSDTQNRPSSSYNSRSDYNNRYQQPQPDKNNLNDFMNISDSIDEELPFI